MNGTITSTFRRGVRPMLRSLLDQLKITDHEIQSRKDLLFFSDADAKLLAELQPVIQENLDDIIETFYERQLRSREVALLIGDAETLKRISEAMRRYVQELFDGVYDAEYVNKRLRIGKVHQRIGLSPKLYVAAMSLLQAILYETIHPKTKDRSLSQKDIDQRAALRKLMLFDMQLSFETYTATLASEVEAMRLELEGYIESLETTVSERTEQLREMTVRDSLTGLYNRRGFDEHLRREMAVAERMRTPMSLIYFDLNNFRLVNDVMGHAAGDRLLAHVGATVLASIRQVDFGCRYGGDEFCVILPKADEDRARLVFDRIRANYEKGEHMGVTLAAGVAQTGPDSYLRAEMLVQLADARMHEAQARAKQNKQYYGRTSTSDSSTSGTSTSGTSTSKTGSPKAASKGSRKTSRKAPQDAERAPDTAKAAQVG